MTSPLRTRQFLYFTTQAEMYGLASDDSTIFSALCRINLLMSRTNFAVASRPKERRAGDASDPIFGLSGSMGVQSASRGVSGR
jgi:hypothetical protein